MSPLPSANPAAATIFVNDRPHPLPAPARVQALVAALGLSGRKGIAIAVNDAVVPRADWPRQALAESDRVLVIQATQGG